MANRETVLVDTSAGLKAALRFLVGWHNGLPAAERRDALHPRVFLASAGRLPESGAVLSRVKATT